MQTKGDELNWELWLFIAAHLTAATFVASVFA
jgi:hypothetical protein